MNIMLLFFNCSLMQISKISDINNWCFGWDMQEDVSSVTQRNTCLKCKLIECELKMSKPWEVVGGLYIWKMYFSIKWLLFKSQFSIAISTVNSEHFAFYAQPLIYCNHPFHCLRFWQASGLSGIISPLWQMYSAPPSKLSRTFYHMARVFFST